MAGQSCPVSFINNLPMESGGTVAGLQRFLNTQINSIDARLFPNGYKPLVVDGKCGPLTYAAWQVYAGNAMADKMGTSRPAGGTTSQRTGGTGGGIILTPQVGPFGGGAADTTPIYKKPIFWIVVVSGLAVFLMATKKR